MAVEFRINRSGIVSILGIAFLVLLFILYSGRKGYVNETNSRPIKISELISASIDLAERSGTKLVEIRKMNSDEIHKLSRELTKEGIDEYVAIGAQMSHEIITSGLKAAWPNLLYKSKGKDHFSNVPLPNKFDTEVSAMARQDDSVDINRITVWIDPLDASHEYGEGGTEPDLLKYNTVLVCVAVDGKPIAGVIHEPFATDIKTGTQGVTKWGWVGHGVSRSLQRDISSESKDGETVRVIASRSHPGDVFSVADSFLQGFKNVEKLVAAGAGYKALQVKC